MSIGISVLICTLNGSATIIPTLQALAFSQNSPPAELILVDNGSTDGVVEIARQFWEQAQRPFPFHFIKEEIPGKSYAIRSGVRAAKYDLILICDDDNALARNYLEHAVFLMRDPTIGCAGGAGIPRIIGEVPPHFYNFAPWFAVGAQIGEPDDAECEILDVSSKYLEKTIWGAGAVFRRIDLMRLYNIVRFPLISGQFKYEDEELCHAVALLDRKLVYTPKLRFEHILMSHRLEASRLTRRHQYGDQHKKIVDAYIELRRIKDEGPILGCLKSIRRYLIARLRGAVDARKYLSGAVFSLKLTRLMTSTELDVFLIGRALNNIGREHDRQPM